MQNNKQATNQNSKKESAKKEAATANYGGLRIRSMASSSYDIWSK